MCGREPMTTPAPLSTIIALARAGALDHAWYQFSAAGYDARGTIRRR
jgi:hypothetical protein